MKTSLSTLTDAALLALLQRNCVEANGHLAERIALLIEVDDRRLYATEAHPSLFEFCLTQLRMSEGEAYRRINAARLVRRFPRLLRRIECGDVHLSALVQLRDHFTEQNVDDLVDMAKGKNKMQLAELIARIAPRPDAPAKLRKIPQHDKASRVTRSTKPSMDPQSDARYRLQVTGSRSFRDKVLYARDLMMHSNPMGDLGVLVERAFDELIKALEKQKVGKPLRKFETATLSAISEETPSKPAASRAPVVRAKRATPTEAPTESATATPTTTAKGGDARAHRRPGLMRAGAARAATNNSQAARVEVGAASHAVRARTKRPEHFRQRKQRKVVDDRPRIRRSA